MAQLEEPLIMAMMSTKLELYTFGSCITEFSSQLLHKEHFANSNDILSRFGQVSTSKSVTQGKVFTCNQYGHLLNAHYLRTFPENFDGHRRAIKKEMKQDEPSQETFRTQLSRRFSLEKNKIESPPRKDRMGNSSRVMGLSPQKPKLAMYNPPHRTPRLSLYIHGASPSLFVPYAN